MLKLVHIMNRRFKARSAAAAAAAAEEGRALMTQIDTEVVVLQGAIRAAEGGGETALLAVARARLRALKEAAIAARALRPENIRFSGALACLQRGPVVGGVV